MALPPYDPNSGMSALEYYLALGMDPNEASAMLAYQMTGNGTTSPQQIAESQIAARASPGTDWFGHNLADPNSPYYMPPITLNPTAGKVIGYTSTGQPITQGSTPGGYTVGATPTATTSGAGGLPPMNSGETSTAYMQRIGMSPQQIAAAQQWYAQNPNATFQQVIAAIGFTPGATQPTTTTTQPTTTTQGATTQGTVLPTQQGNLNTGNLYTANQNPIVTTPFQTRPGNNGAYVPGSGLIPPQYGNAGQFSPYAAIGVTIPHFGQNQVLPGYGIPGFDTGKSWGGGGSWAGTTFTGPGAATGGTQFDPTYDPYSVWKAGGAGLPPSGGNANPLQLGPPNPVTGQHAPAGMIWVPVNLSGGDDPKGNPTYVLQDDPAYTFTPDASGTGGTTTAATGSTGATQTLRGFQVQNAVPWLTTSYLQTYGGKPAPYANIHEQIGASMSRPGPAYPSYQWAIPEEMFAAQPGATGMPPGGWTQMLGYTPGQPANYGFVGGRPNPYGPAVGNAPLINPTIG